MHLSRRLHLALTLLAAVALLVARLGGDHLHLCFDGQEPRVSVHAADGDQHHSLAGADSEHEDQDIDLQPAFLSKVSTAVLDGAALFGVLVLLLLLPRNGGHRPAFEPPRRADRLPLLLRPPLRGPPLAA